MTLAQVHGQIGDAAGHAPGRDTERAGAERAPDVFERLRGDLLDAGADDAGAGLAGGVGVERIGVDGGGGRSQERFTAGQRHLDRAEVREPVRREPLGLSGGPERASDASGGAEPHGRDADPAVPEPWPLQVPAGVGDQGVTADVRVDDDGGAVAAGHAHGLPGARLGRPVVGAQQEQQALVPARAVTRAWVSSFAPDA